MVFFTCSGCGESLKKAQVEKHRYQCRRSQVMSCIDCNKDFHGNDYQQHLKCMSEDQKYGGQNYQAKANKGEVKQEKWYEQVQRAIDSCDSKDPRLRSLLEQIKNYSNIPRKQQKFESFLANSLRVRDSKLVQSAWAAIAAAVEKEKQENQQTSAKDQENPKKEVDQIIDQVENGDQKSNKGSKKRQRETEVPEESEIAKKMHIEMEANGDGKIKKKFNWKKAIKKFLKSDPEKEIKVRVLRREIVRQYLESGRPNEQGEELEEKFDQAVQRLSENQFLELNGKVIRVVKN